MALHQTTTYHWSMLEDVTGLLESGIRTLGVWRRKLDEFGEERAFDLIAESGLAVSSLSWIGGFTRGHAGSYREAIDDALEAIAQAQQLGARCVIVNPGARYGHITSHARRLLVAALRELADPAEEAGVQLALLASGSSTGGGWTFLSSLEDSVRVVEEVESRTVRLALDTYHVFDEPRLCDRLPAIAPLLSVVQVAEGRCGRRALHERRLPGYGEADVGPILKGLLESGYAGVFELQVWSHTHWRENYFRILRSWRSYLKEVCPVHC